MSETMTVSGRCYSQHLLSCLDVLERFKEQEVSKLISDYTCELSNYEGVDEDDYYEISCVGEKIALGEPTTAPEEAPVPRPAEIDDNPYVDRVVSQCDFAYGEATSKLANLLWRLGFEYDGHVDVDLEIAEIKNVWEECKAKAFRLATLKFGSLDGVSCKARLAGIGYEQSLSISCAKDE